VFLATDVSGALGKANLTAVSKHVTMYLGSGKIGLSQEARPGMTRQRDAQPAEQKLANRKT
jgi:hypothetical protein